MKKKRYLRDRIKKKCEAGGGVLLINRFIASFGLLHSFGGICRRVRGRVGCGDWHVRGVSVDTCGEGLHVRRGLGWQGKRIGSRGCVREGLALGVRWICRCVFVLGKSERFCVRTIKPCKCFQKNISKNYYFLF